jgi:hypothetical protein
VLSLSLCALSLSICALSLSKGRNGRASTSSAHNDSRASTSSAHNSTHMASASYTSTVPPDCTTGHPRALSAASVNESALMIE